jgi:hypothetical protein
MVDKNKSCKFIEGCFYLLGPGPLYFCTTLKDTLMDLNGLSPEQIKLIFNLSKRIEILENRLGNLQEKLVRVDRILTVELAQSMKYINLN